MTTDHSRNPTNAVKPLVDEELKKIARSKPFAKSLADSIDWEIREQFRRQVTDKVKTTSNKSATNSLKTSYNK